MKTKIMLYYNIFNNIFRISILFNNLNNNIEMEPITLIGISIIFFYSLTNILKFYGIGEDVYGIYVLFYILIIISILVLPNQYPTV